MTNSAATTSALPAQSALAKARPYNPAPASAARPAGVSTSRVQVIRAETVCASASRRRAPACLATTGTTTPASTPPATISNSTFGSVFAAL